MISLREIRADMACPVIIIFDTDQLVMVATGAQLEFRRH